MAGPVCVFTNMDGRKLALVADEVEAVVELEAGGCQIVTGNDCYKVDAPWPVTAGTIWPELFK